MKGDKHEQRTRVSMFLRMVCESLQVVQGNEVELVLTGLVSAVVQLRQRVRDELVPHRYLSGYGSGSLDTRGRLSP